MLMVLAYSMIAAFMALIMTNRMSALIALILVPIAFALIGGFGAEIPAMVTAGVRAIAPTGVLLLFAILYFGLMIDLGLFDPLVRAIVRFAHGDPVRLIVGSTVLSLIISLDGDGSTTYMLCVTALLPLYRRLKIDPIILAAVVLMPNSIMNIMPWGGPTARVMSVLHVDSSQMLVPMLPSILAASATTLLIAWHFGIKERKRLGTLRVPDDISPHELAGSQEIGQSPVSAERRRKMMPFNLILTLAVLVNLVLGLVPLQLVFMVGFALAMTVNFPALVDQRRRIAEHAPAALSVVSVIFAAGVFTGILNGTKMTDALAQSIVGLVPSQAGNFIPLITALVSAPFTFFLSNDAFYFGVVPILAEAAKVYGIGPEVIARASLIGQPVHQLSPLVAALYVLLGLTGVEIGALQRFVLKWALLLTLVMLVAAGLTGAVPLF